MPWVNSGPPLTGLVLVLLSGCASMTSSPEELQSATETDGIVFGSVLLVAEQGPANESKWAFLRGRKAEGLNYALSISRAGFNPLKTTYSVPAKPGQEEVFVKKLPAGSYNMDALQPTGLLAPTLTLSLAVHFDVKPRQTSYIGKLVVRFPDRIGMGSPADVDILDAQDETIEKLKGEYPSIAPNAVKDLAIDRTFR